MLLLLLLLHVQGCQLCGCAVCLLCRLLAQVVNHLIPAAAGAEHIKEESQPSTALISSKLKPCFQNRQHRTG